MSMERSQGLSDAVVEFYTAMSKGDMGLLNELVSSEAPVVMIGSDPAEWWDTRDRVMAVMRAQLTEMGGPTVEPGEPVAYEQGDVGWAADRPVIRIGDDVSVEARL